MFWEWLGSSPQAPTILAFHGFGGSGQDFEPVAKALDRLGLNWIAPHAHRFASRDFENEVSSSMREAFLLSIHEKVKASGVRRPIVMGYSMGGRIALQYALKYKEFIRGLILVGTTPGISSANLMLERRQMEAAWIQKIKDEGVVAFQSYWQTLPVMASQARIPREVREAIRKRRRAVLPSELIFSLKSFGQGFFPPLWEAVSQLDIPTLLVAGANDEKYCKLAQAMQKYLQRGHVERIPHAGHAAHLENTPLFANCCEKFINRLVSEK